MQKIVWKISCLMFLLIALDQFTKYLAYTYLQTTHTLISKFLQLEYSQNTGVAFGLKMPYFFLLTLSFFLIIIVFYVAYKEFDLKKILSQIVLSLILGGAIGNIIDRLIHGFVIDFIAIWKWPNFNLADTYITLGILLVIVFYGKIKTEK